MNQTRSDAPMAEGSGPGFVRGMTQPAQHLTVRVVRRAEVDFERLDKRLVEIFGTEFVPCRQASVNASRNDTELAWRTLLVCRDILQAGGVPVFDPGLILAVDRIPGNDKINQARCLFPAIPCIPVALIRDAFRSAVAVTGRLAGSPADGAALEALLENIHENVVSRLRRTVGGGESTVPMIQAAYERGIPFMHLGRSIYRLGWGMRSLLVDRSAVETDAAIGARLSHDKFMTAQVLHGAGIPCSRHMLVSSRTQALEAAETIGWPLVVKPADRDRGEGVSVGISDPQALAKAYDKAADLSRAVLVEAQVPGVCHRIFVSRRQKVIGVSQRLPKSVKGDGSHTIGELIEEANQAEMKKAPWRRLKRFPVDDLACQCLAAAGFTLDSIPADGQYAPLRYIQSDADGGVSEDKSRDVHPENIDIALRASALFGLDSAGIDLISQDISRPWYENGAIINEVNFASLLGGHRTDARARDYPGQHLDLVIQDRGRLPVEVYVGGDGAMAAALERQQRLVDDGIQCYAASHSASWRPDGSTVGVGKPGLFGRTLHLVADKNVESLILVVQTDELLYTGCPIDGLGTIHAIDPDLVNWKDPSRPVPLSSRNRLMTLLSAFSRPVTPVVGG